MLIFQIGDLVLIPANVNIYRELGDIIVRMDETDKPDYAILLGKSNKDNLNRIFMAGEYWLVDDDGIFEVNENEFGDIERNHWQHINGQIDKPFTSEGHKISSKR